MDDLIAAALAARARAYAPYSRFLVGAALRTTDGAIHAGCNVENAAYPQGVCAEAGAISAMILAGGTRIAELVVAGAGGTAVISGGGAMPVTPCGGCRQKIREFATPDTRIHMVDDTGRLLVSTTLADLLPMSFGPEHLA